MQCLTVVLIIFLVFRGDPDRSDIWGNTPLHHAASNGHLRIVSFLVSFGANIFAMDNDLHTPLDVAASRDNMECVRFLDSAASQQTGKNAKKVEALKKRATKEAQERVKRCEKVKKKHQNKMDKRYRDSIVPETSAASFSNTGTINSVNDQFSKLIAADKSGSLSSRVKGTLQRKFGKKDTVSGMVERQGKAEGRMGVGGSRRRRRSFLTGVRSSPGLSVDPPWG